MLESGSRVVQRRRKFLIEVRARRTWVPVQTNFLRQYARGREIKLTYKAKRDVRSSRKNEDRAQNATKHFCHSLVPTHFSVGYFRSSVAITKDSTILQTILLKFLTKNNTEICCDRKFSLAFFDRETVACLRFVPVWQNSRLCGYESTEAFRALQIDVLQTPWRETT